MKRSFYNRFGKRVLDILLILLAAPLVLPVCAAIALLVRMRLGSPVLFRQTRPGRDGRCFSLFKFRSMTDRRDTTGRLLSDTVRLPRFGKQLRSTSLDELPELWNVLKGEMSLVGPRPLLVEYLDRYTPEQKRRHDVRPGLTGWAQVQGRNSLSWEERFRLDVWYVDHVTLMLDLRILALTVRRVISRDGISEPGNSTMTPFHG